MMGSPIHGPHSCGLEFGITITFCNLEPAAGGMMNTEFTNRIGEVVAAEGSLSLPTSAFLEAALPAVPALLLGFVFLEGRELVRN